MDDEELESYWTDPSMSERVEEALDTASSCTITALKLVIYAALPLVIICIIIVASMYFKGLGR